MNSVAKLRVPITKLMIYENLKILNPENKVVEVRILNTPKGVISGYFNDMEKLSREVWKYNGKYNIFLMLNKCSEELLGRSENKLSEYAKNLTKDADIVKRTGLLIDIDPVRPTNTSSTKEEHDAAINRTKEIQNFLSETGFPVPILADSGNGAHLIYKVDIENNKENADLVKAFLNSLSVFSDNIAHVDTSVWNASRLLKLYGTIAVKGEHTQERPHRLSQFIEVPENMEIVTKDMLKRVIDELQDEPTAIIDNKRNVNNPSNTNYENVFNVEKFIETYGLDVVNTKNFPDGRKLWRIICPMKEHKDKAAFIKQFPNGAISARCHHEKCKWSWKDLRATYDKDYAEKRKRFNSTPETEIPPENLQKYNEILLSKGRGFFIDARGWLCHTKETRNGGSMKVEISNFIAVPIETIVEIDGVSGNEKESRLTKFLVFLEGKEFSSITISNTEFLGMRWHLDLSLHLTVFSGFKAIDKAREAIQLLIGNIPITNIYSHVGFRYIDEKWCYLHSKGAIGRENVAVGLEKNNLSGYELADTEKVTKEELNLSIQKSLKCLEIHQYSRVLFAFTFLSPLCETFAQKGNLPPFSLWLHGRSGSQKTSVAALFLNFFGREFSKTKLPASFSETANSLEKKLAMCKDALTVIDDLHPAIDESQKKKQMQMVQNKIFDIANRSARGRMRPDETLKKALIPLGMAMFTSEYSLDSSGESTITRLLSVEFRRGSVNLDILGECQSNKEYLNITMSCYIAWLAGKMEALPTEIHRQFIELRESFKNPEDKEDNQKLNEIKSFMLIGMKFAMRYFIEVGAIAVEYANNIVDKLRNDLAELIDTQKMSITSNSCVEKFIDAVKYLLTTHALHTKYTIGAESTNSNKEFVGWHDDKNYFFLVTKDTGGIYVAVKKWCAQNDLPFDIKPQALYKLLVDEGIVTETDKDRNCKTKNIKGKSHKVLVIPKEVFFKNLGQEEPLEDSDW